MKHYIKIIVVYLARFILRALWLFSKPFNLEVYRRVRGKNPQCRTVIMK